MLIVAVQSRRCAFAVAVAAYFAVVITMTFSL